MKRHTIGRLAVVPLLLLVAAPATAATITGTNGDDVLDGTPGNDTISARGGDDVVRAFAGKDTVTAGTGDDTVYGGRGRDAIKGLGGDDRLFGGDRHDEIAGGYGDDRIEGGRGPDIVSDFVLPDFGANPGVDHDVIVTGRGDDTVLVERGVDRVFTGRGADVVITYDDNAADLIDCGPNRGKVKDGVTYEGSRDPADTLRNCEIVSVVD
jgi:Ca2+-binding RTX toxin-like protein